MFMHHMIVLIKSTFIILKFLTIIDQGILCLHFALESTNDVASPVSHGWIHSTIAFKILCQALFVGMLNMNIMMSLQMI